jgi:hypothetical protein
MLFIASHLLSLIKIRSGVEFFDEDVEDCSG